MKRIILFFVIIVFATCQEIVKCEKYHEFYNKERFSKQINCLYPKIKDYIYDSCENERNTGDVVYYGFYSVDKRSFFSLEQVMKSVEFSNLDPLGQPCAIIDWESRTCLPTLDQCHGFIRNKIFCQQCDCQRNYEKIDKLCEETCKCKGQVEYIEHEYRVECRQQCDKNSIQYLQFCLKSDEKFPGEVKRDHLGNQHHKACLPNQKLIIKVDGSKECVKCLRVGSNNLCSDKCPKFQQLLIQKANNVYLPPVCEEAIKSPEHAYFKEGCLYPLTLSVDKEQCLTECLTGQKLVELANNLSMCVSECGEDQYESSDGKHCVSECHFILEVKSNTSRKCQSCQNGLSLRNKSSNDDSILELECAAIFPEFLKNAEKAFALFKVIENVGELPIIELNRIEQEMYILLDEIIAMPKETLSERHNHFVHASNFFKLVDQHIQIKSKYFLGRQQPTYDFPTDSFGYPIHYGIMKNKCLKIYEILFKLSQSTETGVSSVSIQSSFTTQSQILKIDEVQFCSSEANCSKATMFQAFQEDDYDAVFQLEKRFQRNSRYFCVSETLELNKQSQQITHVAKFKVANRSFFSLHEFSCSFKKNIGLILFKNEESLEDQFQIKRTIPFIY